MTESYLMKKNIKDYLEDFKNIEETYSKMIETTFKAKIECVMFTSEVFTMFPTLKGVLEHKFNRTIWRGGDDGYYRIYLDENSRWR